MRIDHVNLIVPPGSLDAVSRFWTSVFGLTAVERHGRSGRPGAWLQGAGFQIHLSDRDGPVHPDQHLALVVEDYQTVRATALELGADWEDAQPVTGSARGFVRDPGGNRIEVLTDD